jgi:hypothetical protein
MILVDYVSHNLIHIHIYELIIIYFEKSMLTNYDCKASKQPFIFSIPLCALQIGALSPLASFKLCSPLP